MSISLSLGVGLTSLRGILGGIRARITGLTSGVAEIGDHAILTAVMSDGSTITAFKWGSTEGGTQYGTGAAPTDYEAGDGGTLYLTATAGGQQYTASAPILYPEPVAGSLAPVSETQAVGTIIVDLSAGFQGSNPGTYTADVGWITINGSNAEIDQDQVLDASAQITKTNSGGSDTVALAVTISAVGVAVPVNSVAPAITGDGKVGTGHTVSTGTWDAYDEIQYRWLRDGTPNGDTDAAYTPAAADNLTDLGAEVRTRNTNGAWSAWVAATPVAITYEPPTAAGELDPVTYTQNSGDQTVATAGDFTGVDLVFTKFAGPAVATVNSSTGVVTITTNNALSSTAITVRATNPGGFADSTFNAAVTAAATPPTVTNYTVTPTSSTSVRVTFNTSQIEGPFYWVVTLNSTDLNSGQISGGTGGTQSGNQPVNSPNPQTVDITGLTTGVQVWVQGLHYNLAGQKSPRQKASATPVGAATPVINTWEVEQTNAGILFTWDVDNTDGPFTADIVGVPNDETAPSIAQAVAGNKQDDTAAPFWVDGYAFSGPVTSQSLTWARDEIYSGSTDWYIVVTNASGGQTIASALGVGVTWAKDWADNGDWASNGDWAA